MRAPEGKARRCGWPIGWWAKCIVTGGKGWEGVGRVGGLTCSSTRDEVASHSNTYILCIS